MIESTTKQKTKTADPLMYMILHLRVQVTINNPRYLNVGPASRLANALDMNLATQQKQEPHVVVIDNNKGGVYLYVTLSPDVGTPNLNQIIKDILHELET